MNTYTLYVDEKMSVWYRTTVEVEADTIEEAAQKALDEDYEIICGEPLDETYEYMTIKENGGAPTVEIVNTSSTVLKTNCENDSNGSI